MGEKTIQVLTRHIVHWRQAHSFMNYNNNNIFHIKCTYGAVLLYYALGKVL